MFRLSTYFKIFLFIICMNFSQLASGIKLSVYSEKGHNSGQIKKYYKGQIDIEENDTIVLITNKIMKLIPCYIMPFYVKYVKVKPFTCDKHTIELMYDNKFLYDYGIVPSSQDSIIVSCNIL